MDNFDRHFERHATRARNLMIVAIITKLAISGALIWLAVYAINAFAA